MIKFFSVYFSLYFVLMHDEMVVTHDGPTVSDDVKDAISVELVPTPYSILKEHQRLTSLSWEGRKELCSLKILQIEEPIFQYVSEVIGDAHLYKFDNEENLLAIRCDTLPAVYVGLPDSGKISNERWYIRSVKPPKRNWTFTTEVVENVLKEETDYSDFYDWKFRLHIFHTLTKVERWFLCNEVRKMTRYETKPIAGQIGLPQYYWYKQGGWSETYLTILCPTEPKIFLQYGSSGIENEITITFKRDDVINKLTPVEHDE